MEYFYVILFGTISILLIFFMCWIGIKSDSFAKAVSEERNAFIRPVIPFDYTWTTATTLKAIRKRSKKKFQRKPCYMKRKPKIMFI